MADGFKEREKGAEAKWAHDEDMRFKVMARRNKLLGQWAAAEMGLSGEAVDTYVREVIAADFEEAGDEDVLRKVAGDFAARGVARDKPAIRAKMDALLTQAVQEVTSDKR